MSRFFTAIGTPLTDDDSLHVEGLEKQVDNQRAAGIEGLLVAGSMGLCQLQSDATWLDLIEHTLRTSHGDFEVLIGVGDTSFPRTRDRINSINHHSDIDGVVILTPYLYRYRDEELVDYYTALADLARSPLFLYDLPQLVGYTLSDDVLMQVARHPNIAGVKCSGDYDRTRHLMDTIGGNFRFIVAQADQIDRLTRDGIAEQLDGIFSIAPHWVKAIGSAAQRNDNKTAAKIQKKLTAARDKMIDLGIWASFTAVMNAIGIPGRFAPRPYRMLSETQQHELLAFDPIAELLCGTNPDTL